jgi:hypothetical protein
MAYGELSAINLRRNWKKGRKTIQKERKIWGLHSSDYEELCILACYAVWLL